MAPSYSTAPELAQLAVTNFFIARQTHPADYDAMREAGDLSLLNPKL